MSQWRSMHSVGAVVRWCVCAGSAMGGGGGGSCDGNGEDAVVVAWECFW